MKVIKVTGADFSALGTGCIVYADIMKQKGWITPQNKLSQLTYITAGGEVSFYDVIKVTPGQTVSVKANNSQATIMLFLKSLMPAPLADNTLVDVATDSTRILINAGTTETQTAPSDANFVAVGIQSIAKPATGVLHTENRFPAMVTIDGLDITNRLVK